MKSAPSGGNDLTCCCVSDLTIPTLCLVYFTNRWVLLSFCLYLADKLPLDDLKKLREWLLLQICNTSDLLVELLQDRQRLSEEVHVRLISIEQLHRLLEARCYFGGLSTGLFS